MGRSCGFVEVVENLRIAATEKVRTREKTVHGSNIPVTTYIRPICSRMEEPNENAI